MSELSTTDRLERIRERFTADPVQLQLAGLAANLARLSSFIENPANARAAMSLFVESKLMIEWIAPHVPLETQEQLVELQIQLGLWSRRIGRREKISKQAARWSDRLLAMSRLGTGIH